MEAKKKSERTGNSHELIHRVYGQFILMNRLSFSRWLKENPIKRKVKFIQNHHTWRPDYSNFNGENHFSKLKGMKRSHLNRGFSDIAQNLTTFPDGLIAVCRSMETTPAGISGKNTGGVCIEHLGNFDIGGDQMTDEHKETIVWLNAELLKCFELNASIETVVYHTWYASKSCPGTNFFGGNTKINAENNFIPLIKAKL